MICQHYQCFMELLYACRVKKVENIINHIFMRYMEEKRYVETNSGKGCTEG